jgi:hypothetical protein
MKRKIPEVVPEKLWIPFKKWFTWVRCCRCHLEFRRETGYARTEWHSPCMGEPGHYTIIEALCNTCITEKEKEKEKVRK